METTQIRGSSRAIARQSLGTAALASAITLALLVPLAPAHGHLPALVTISRETGCCA
jgi:hypothetical protein